MVVHCQISIKRSWQTEKTQRTLQLPERKVAMNIQIDKINFAKEKKMPNRDTH